MFFIRGEGWGALKCRSINGNSLLTHRSQNHCWKWTICHFIQATQKHCGQFLQSTGYMKVLCTLVNTGTLPVNYWMEVLLCLNCGTDLPVITWYCIRIPKNPCFHLSNYVEKLAFLSRSLSQTLNLQSVWIHAKHCSFPVLTTLKFRSFCRVFFKFVIIFLGLCNYTICLSLTVMYQANIISASNLGFTI